MLSLDTTMETYVKDAVYSDAPFFTSNNPAFFHDVP